MWRSFSPLCWNYYADVITAAVSIPLSPLCNHYNDVTMTTMASQITSLMVVYSTVYSDADQRKHQSSASLAFVWGIHRDRWIPRTKGQLRGKYSHLMTSSCWIGIWCLTIIGKDTLLQSVVDITGPESLTKIKQCYNLLFLLYHSTSNLHMIQDRLTIMLKPVINSQNDILTELQIFQWPLLLIKFNFYPSMDK